MKRVISLLVCAVILITGCLLYNISALAAELTLVDGHYEVKTAEEFLSIPQKVYGEYWIMNDIDLTGSEVSTAYFINWLNGGKIYGKAEDGTAKNVTIKTNKVIFNQMDGGEIKNITVEGTITGSNANRQGALALMAGSGAVIENCINRASVTGAGNNVGGLIGNVHSGDLTLKNCKNEGNVSSSGSNASYTGGIIGMANNLTVIESCENSGSVNGVTYVGGIAGYLKGGSSAMGGVNNGKITASGNYAGGIAGLADSTAVIDGCTNEEEVKSASYAGGTVGSVAGEGTVKACINNGKVSVTANYAGGICGVADSAATVEKCINNGEITGTSLCGGITGYLKSEAQVLGCTNEGKLSITGNYAGGIAGLMEGRSKVSGSSNEGIVNAVGRSGGIAGIIRGNANIDASSNKGEVTVSGNYAGGIAGDGAGSTGVEIAGCFNAGNVTANSHCAGIIAITDPVITISKCYNAGTITGTTSYAGGIASYFKGTEISDCYNAGAVLSPKSGSTKGGIVAYVGGDSITLTRCYNAVANVTDAFFPTTAKETTLNDCYYIDVSTHYEEEGTSLTPREGTDIEKYGVFKDNGWVINENEYNYIFPQLSSNPHSMQYDINGVSLSAPVIRYVGKLTDGSVIVSLGDTNPSYEVKHYSLIFKSEEDITGISYEFTNKTVDVTEQVKDGVEYTLTVVAASDSKFDSPESRAVVFTKEELSSYYRTRIISTEGGTTDRKGTNYVKEDEEMVVTATPSEGKVLEYIIYNGTEIPVGSSEEYSYTVPADSDAVINFVFAEVTEYPQVTSYEASYSEIRGGNKPAVYVFARLSNTAGYTRESFGMLLSSDEISEEEFKLEGKSVTNAVGRSEPNVTGQFGMMFTGNGLTTGTYYTRPYATYRADNGDVVTVYGDIVPFTVQ